MKPTQPTTAQRPPGRPRAFELDEALNQAIVVFSERGYSGASISHLREATGLTAGSLYKAFADKRALFLAALEHYVASRNDKLRHALAAAPTGRERVRQVLLLYAESSLDAEGRRGCLLISSAMALSVTEPAVAERIAQALHANESRLFALLQQGQQDGSVPCTLDCAAVARLLLCVLQGMRVIAKTGRTRPEMMALVDQALKLLA